MHLAPTHEAPSSTPWYRRAWAPWAALFLLCTVHLVANNVWLALDRHVIRIDESFHARGAREFYKAMVLTPENTPAAVQDLVTPELLSPYPPLLHVLGAFTALVLGYSEDSLSFTSTLIFIAIILGGYAIARQWLGRWSSVFAALLISLTPAVYGASRHLVQDYLAAACVVWAIYALLRSDRFTRPGWVLLFGALNGLGLLARQTAPIHLLVPSAVVALLGLVYLLRQAQPRRRALALRWLAGIALTLGATGAVGAPWYVANYDYLYDYWWGQHKGGGGPLRFASDWLAPAEKEAPAVQTPAAPPAVGEPTTPAARAQRDNHSDAMPMPPPPGTEVVRTERPRIWSTYLVHVINNGAFLPLTLISLAGMLAALFNRRLRTWQTLVLLAWLVGTPLLMTLILRFHTPRYALPFLPAVGIFAAFAIASLPRPARWATGSLVVLWLAVQYVHLSFAPFLPTEQLRIAIADTPALRPMRGVAKTWGDEGLVVYKDHIIQGTYSYYRPLREANYVERALQKMLDADATRRVKREPTANYVCLWNENNFGGFELLQEEFWPSPYPLRRAYVQPDGPKVRPLLRLSSGTTVDAVNEDIIHSDYAVVMLRQSHVSWGLWYPFHQNLRRAGFEVIDYYEAPARGRLPAAYVTVMQRYNPKPLEEAANVFDLARILDAADQLPAEEVAEARRRLRAELEQVPAEARSPLTNVIDLLAYGVERISGPWFRIHLIMHVKDEPQFDRNILVRGRTSPQVTQYLTELNGGVPPDPWMFMYPPLRLSTTWRVNTYVHESIDVYAPPVPIDVHVSLHNPEQETPERTVGIGEIDFGRVP